MTFSINNRLILEQYVKEGLKPKMQGGIATPGQRDGMKGLRVLISTTLPDGRQIPAGSLAYIREEVLHTHPWASKPLTCDTLSEKFMVVELNYIEFFKTLNDVA
jgi:hypothetical protein